MSQEKAKTIKFAYGLAFGIMSLVLSFLLILQVCDIYFNGGESPYTAAAIAQHFKSIAFFVVLWVVMVIGGFIIWELFPTKDKPVPNDAFYTYDCLKRKLGSKPIVKSETYDEYAKYAWIVFAVKFAVGVCVGICVVFGLAYLCDSGNFTNQDQNKEVAKAALYLLPFVVVSFGLCIGVAVFEKAVIKQQTPRVKQLLKQSVEGEPVKRTFDEIISKIKTFFDKQSTINGMRLGVAVIGTVLLVYGLATGGNAGVLAKAITICRQCIGLG